MNVDTQKRSLLSNEITEMQQCCSSFNLLFMVALCNRADHIYFYAVVCSFFHRLISAAADWMSAIHTWCGLSANLRCRSETCCTRLIENTGRKKVAKIAIWAPSHNFDGLYLRMQQVSDLHLKFALRPHHVWMADIQSAAAEIRR